MIKWIERVMAAARKYTVIDYGFFKLLMVAFGILLGVYFPSAMGSIIGLVWIVFILSAIWMLYTIFKYTK